MERTKPKGRYNYINREKNRMRKKWRMIVKKERLEREWGYHLSGARLMQTCN